MISAWICATAAKSSPKQGLAAISTSTLGTIYDANPVTFVIKPGSFLQYGLSGPVSALAQRQLPTLRNHLRMAIALERSDGRSSEIGMARDRDRDDNQYRGDNQYRDDRNRDDNQYRGDNQYRDDRAPYRQR